MAFWPPALPEPTSVRKPAELTSLGIFAERTKKLPELTCFRVFAEQTKKLADRTNEFRSVQLTNEKGNLWNQRGLGYLQNERSNGYGFLSLKIRETTFFNPCRERRRMTRTKNTAEKNIYKEHVATSVDQSIRVT